MTVKLHVVQILLILILIFAVIFTGNQSTSSSCPQPIINNYIDVNISTPPIVFDKNMFTKNDANYSPNIIVTVNQKPVSESAGNSTTYVTNNYITDVNTPLVYYPFSIKVVDKNGNIIFNDANNFSDGTPALSAMQKMLTVEYTQFVYGAMILSINGITAMDHEYWALYEDGNYANVGISAMVINKPTSIEWRIESW